jgi:K+-sensing histidine kinase KdpD
MFITKRELTKLSENIRKIIDGQKVDLRDNREGKLSILKNDIHTLANQLTEQADNAQKEKEALRQALADISHQIKTPLTSLSVMVDLLEDAPAERQAEFIHNIKASIIRTEWLASALLKMAKFESGTITFGKESTSAALLTKAALKPLQILLELKNQQVEMRQDVAMICDSRWTVEALTNILKNASEYSPEGGTIVVEGGENPLCTWISVTDCGKGLTNKEMASLFRRFDGSRSAHGIGIGLPLSLAILRGQNGDIEAENVPGGGAKFIMKLYHSINDSTA